MTPTVAKVIWLAFGIAWFALRYEPRRRAKRTPVRHSGRDTREIVLLTVSFCGLGVVPAVYLASHFPRFADYPFVPLQGYLGVAVYSCALWMFHLTHRDLGRNWSVSLDVRENHTLVTTGIYALVRHPMYSGFWLMALAQVLLLPNWIAGPAGLVGFGTLFFGRVRREEAMMMAAFGEEYRAYMNRTARVVPWIY
jgi:protein-S-isoprenylcysteine O-methyltransferase Ste14